MKAKCSCPLCKEREGLSWYNARWWAEVYINANNGELFETYCNHKTLILVIGITTILGCIGCYARHGWPI